MSNYSFFLLAFLFVLIPHFVKHQNLYCLSPTRRAGPRPRCTLGTAGLSAENAWPRGMARAFERAFATASSKTVFLSQYPTERQPHCRDRRTRGQNWACCACKFLQTCFAKSQNQWETLLYSLSCAGLIWNFGFIVSRRGCAMVTCGPYIIVSKSTVWFLLSKYLCWK